MALTKEFEYDCEVRGVYKDVQVRMATVVKDDGTEIDVTITGMFYTAALRQMALGATQTSQAKMQPFRQYAMRFGLTALSLVLRLLWIAKKLLVTSNGKQDRPRFNDCRRSDECALDCQRNSVDRIGCHDRRSCFSKHQNMERRSGASQWSRLALH